MKANLDIPQARISEEWQLTLDGASAEPVKLAELRTRLLYWQERGFVPRVYQLLCGFLQEAACVGGTFTLGNGGDAISGSWNQISR